MYRAQFETDAQSWWVAAARAEPGGRSLWPPALQALLAGGTVPRFALRCDYAAGGMQAMLLLPGSGGDLPPALAAPSAWAGLRWAADAAEFDAWSAPPGDARCRLETGAFGVDGVACPLAATWLTDRAEWRSLAAQGSFSHQLNVRWSPAGPEAQRRLRKHLARVALLAAEGAWPARMQLAQQQALQARLASPWLADELLAAEDAGLLSRLQAGLRQRLCAVGGAACADGAVECGRFDELWLTGLDLASFGTDAGTPAGPEAALAEVGHALPDEALRALLGARAEAPADDLADPGAPRPLDLFISHASADAALAARLCRALEALGLRCWIAPRDIAAGQSYAEGIMGALRRCRGLLLLLSPEALASTHVQRELERAVSLRCRVLPLRLAAVEPQGAFEYLLSGCQWTDCPPGADLGPVAARLVVGLGPSE